MPYVLGALFIFVIKKILNNRYGKEYMKLYYTGPNLNLKTTWLKFNESYIENVMFDIRTESAFHIVDTKEINIIAGQVLQQASVRTKIIKRFGFKLF